MEKNWEQQTEKAITYPEERGLFKGLEVPIVSNAIILAFVGYVVFMLGVMGIDKLISAVGNYGDNFSAYECVVNTLGNWAAKFPGGRRVFDVVIRPVLLVEPGPTPPAEWWMFLIFGGWFVIVWSLFAGAISRIFAFRIGRDETITLSEALAFGIKTWPTHIFSAILVAAFIGLMFVGAWVITLLLGRIPYVKVVTLWLMIPATLLVLLLSFILAVLVVGLLFCFNMISSAIAAEYTDSFDAVTRAYTYVIERPWHAILYTFLTAAMVAVFLFFAGLGLRTAESAIAYGLGDKQFAPVKKYLGKNYSNTDPITGKTVSLNDAFAGYKADDGSTISLKAFAVCMRYIFWVVYLLLFATAASVWLGCRMKTYLLLRYEVDGDEPDEIYLEEEEELIEEKPPVAPPEKAEEKPKEEEKKEEKAEKEETAKVKEEEKKEEKEKEQREEKPSAKEEEKKEEEKGEEKKVREEKKGKEEREEKKSRGRKKKDKEKETTEGEEKKE